MSKPPPTRIVRAAGAVRSGLQSLTRRMAPPEVSLLELVSGFMATHAVYAAARLGIADALGDEKRFAGDLAAEIGADPDATYRLLRACATFGVFTEDTAGRFAQTPLSTRLRSGTPDSMLPVVLMLGDPRYQRPWGRLVDTVRSGTPGVESELGAPMWAYLDADPEFGALFNDAMDRLTALDWPTVEARYDFSRFSTIVDIGGGHGKLLALMLGAAPNAKGVLMERASLVPDAQEQLRRAGVLGRCRIEVGSFLETAPSDGDLYVLRRVLHDFDDEQAVRILTTVRRQMPIGSTLLLLESVVPAGDTPHFAKTLDLDMMIFVGGRERTEQQFGRLLERAGFTGGRIIPTISTISLIEAIPGN